MNILLFKISILDYYFNCSSVFYSRLNAAIIREVYDNVHASENFLLDLERALDAGRNVIVIEPKDLGEETARWIAAGNYLQKTAVFTGLGAIFTGITFV